MIPDFLKAIFGSSNDESTSPEYEEVTKSKVYVQKKIEIHWADDRESSIYFCDEMRWHEGRLEIAEYVNYSESTWIYEYPTWDKKWTDFFMESQIDRVSIVDRREKKMEYTVEQEVTPDE